MAFNVNPLKKAAACTGFGAGNGPDNWGQHYSPTGSWVLGKALYRRTSA